MASRAEPWPFYARCEWDVHALQYVSAEETKMLQCGCLSGARVLDLAQQPNTGHHNTGTIAQNDTV